MSLLENIIGQVVKNTLSNSNNPPNNSSQSTSNLSNLLGQVLGNHTTPNHSQNTSLGSLLGSVLGQSQTPNHSTASNVLGTLLGNQGNVAANDLGNLLGSLIKSQLGGQNKTQGKMNKNALLLALLPVILNYIQKNGGLSGVLNKFRQSGLGNQVQSWVGLNSNDQLGATEVAKLFDRQEISQICQQTGASESEVCQGIAELLPQVVNDLTPHGDINTDERDANEEISAILQQFAQAKH